MRGPSPGARAVPSRTIRIVMDLGPGRSRCAQPLKQVRRGSESNRRPRLCRPLHNHSATPPPTLARLHPTSAPRRTANQGWRGPPQANGVGCMAAGTRTASRATKLKTGDRSYRLDLPGNLERETRLELATPTLARLDSTTELFPRKNGHRIIEIRHLVSRQGAHSCLPSTNGMAILR